MIIDPQSDYGKRLLALNPATPAEQDEDGARLTLALERQTMAIEAQTNVLIAIGRALAPRDAGGDSTFSL